MNTILIITHPGIGKTLRDAALATLKNLPCDVIAIDCPQDADTQAIAQKTLEMLSKKNTDDHFIIFSDVFGATPHKMAKSIAEKTQQNTRLISGINRAMLMRTLNYINLPLDTVCEKAIEGGHNGICDCHDTQEHPSS